MKFINLVAISLAISGLFSSPLMAQQQTCLSQLEDQALMMKSKREGLFREPLPRSHSTFSYNIEQAFSDYLTAAVKIRERTYHAQFIPIPISNLLHKVLDLLTQQLPI